MHIDGYKLVGEGIVQHATPNQGGLFAPGAPDTLVIHFTAGASIAWAIAALCDPKSAHRVSAHLVVGRDGSITQLLPFDTIAWHAGRSTWGGRTRFNDFSIGIEIDNAGRLQTQGDGFVSWKGNAIAASEVVEGTHRNEKEPSWWHKYPQSQLDVVEALCRLLVDDRQMRWILGHEEIAPGRKDDPGPAFPLDDLRRRVLPAPMRRYDDTDDPAA